VAKKKKKKQIDACFEIKCSQVEFLKDTCTGAEYLEGRLP
jgi:hypothetical protein